jgi:hypothetical protein
LGGQGDGAKGEVFVADQPGVCWGVALASGGMTGGCVLCGQFPSIPRFGQKNSRLSQKQFPVIGTIIFSNLLNYLADRGAGE